MPTIRIRELRKQKHVAQKDLGTALGVGQSTVSAWERGRRSPEVDQLQKLSEYFEVSVDYLLGFDSAYGTAPRQQEVHPEEQPPAEDEAAPEDNGLQADDVAREISRLENCDISPEGILQLCRFYEYVKVRYPARRSRR